tara:strand:- start:1217 stop:1348 length:132 start_codon:yes stop_codon:yes gene_type:complete
MRRHILTKTFRFIDIVNGSLYGLTAGLPAEKIDATQLDLLAVE